MDKLDVTQSFAICSHNKSSHLVILDKVEVIYSLSSALPASVESVWVWIVSGLWCMGDLSSNWSFPCNIMT